MSIVVEVQALIEKAIPGSKVSVLDPMQDETHLEAIVVSDSFDGKSRLERHRMVMTPLTEHFRERLHALKLKTFTQEQYDNR